MENWLNEIAKVDLMDALRYYRRHLRHKDRTVLSELRSLPEKKTTKIYSAVLKFIARYFSKKHNLHVTK